MDQTGFPKAYKKTSVEYDVDLILNTLAVMLDIRSNTTTWRYTHNPMDDS